MTREEALDETAVCIGVALRKRWHLQPDELWVDWSLHRDGHAMIHVHTAGAGQAVQNDRSFDAALIALRDEHIAVLDGERWTETVGDEQVVRELSDGDLASRLRAKVKG